MDTFRLNQYEIFTKDIWRNCSTPELYEAALTYEKGSAISNTGSLLVYSGKKTGRSPKDKRIVRNPESENNIDWGDINIELDEHTFMINRERAIDYLNTRDRIFVVDAFAGWDKKYRLKIRVICTRAYHALFMQNMLIMPTAEELEDFGEPDYTIFNGGSFPANRYTSKMTSRTSIDINLERKEIVILGTEYAGEMKKGVFSVMNYLMPLQNVLPMHCSINLGTNKDVTIFFGLSGTGKTTLSADPKRKLIGDDEHCWTDNGVFNIEGGCYAKAINLNEENEPEIYRAIRFGTILENVVYDPKTRVVDYTDTSVTQNTRASYPIGHMENIQVPCTADLPSNIIFLTCDAFGLLPPVSKLTPEQAAYHFIAGYTAKVAGTEMGVKEPQATFSACFGAAFMMWHPNHYAKLLVEKMEQTKAKAWLVNTGWTGGPYGIGSRIKLKYTRAIIDAIHNGDFNHCDYDTEPKFGFNIPLKCPQVPTEIMIPRNTWSNQSDYDYQYLKLIQLFKDNFKKYESQVSPKIIAGGPQL